MRAPAKIGLAIAVVVVASCSGSDRDEKAPPRDLSGARALTPGNDRVAVSPLEAGQAGKTEHATSAHRAVAQAAPHIKAPPAAEAVPVAPTSVGSSAPAATQEPVADPQMSAMQTARMDPAAATAPEPAPGVSGPFARPAGNEAIGDGNGESIPHMRGGIIILRGGPGGIDDDCDELNNPQRPNQPVSINTRAPNMGGSLGNPTGGSMATPRSGMPGTIGTFGGGIRGGIRGGGGGMSRGGIHH